MCENFFRNLICHEKASLRSLICHEKASLRSLICHEKASLRSLICHEKASLWSLICHEKASLRGPSVTKKQVEGNLLHSKGEGRETVTAGAREVLGEKLTGTVVKWIYVPSRQVNLAVKAVRELQSGCLFGAAR